MPEVENVSLRPPAPVEDRKAAAMERHADEAKALQEAQNRLAAAVEQAAGVVPPTYHRPTHYWEALMAVVQSRSAPDVSSALVAARELTDGFEVEFPTYVTGQTAP